MALRNADAVERIAADTVARFGRIDILVNCVGIGPYRALGAMDAPFIRAILDANILGTILVTQKILPRLTAPGGHIVNFASALAFRPIPTNSVYAASKAAIVTLTHAWSKELGPKGITVVASTPLGRIGQTDDTALPSADRARISGEVRSVTLNSQAHFVRTGKGGSDRTPHWLRDPRCSPTWGR